MEERREERGRERERRREERGERERKRRKRRREKTTLPFWSFYYMLEYSAVRRCVVGYGGNVVLDFGCVFALFLVLKPCRKTLDALLVVAGSGYTRCHYWVRGVDYYGTWFFAR